MSETFEAKYARYERVFGAALDQTMGAVAYECWGCGETFTFSRDWGIDMEGEPCPNRCGNVLSPA